MGFTNENGIMMPKYQVTIYQIYNETHISIYQYQK